jgi:hypothetical protein
MVIEEIRAAGADGPAELAGGHGGQADQHRGVAVVVVAP